MAASSSLVIGKLTAYNEASSEEGKEEKKETAFSLSSPRDQVTDDQARVISDFSMDITKEKKQSHSSSWRPIAKLPIPIEENKYLNHLIPLGKFHYPLSKGERILGINANQNGSLVFSCKEIKTREAISDEDVPSFSQKKVKNVVKDHQQVSYVTHAGEMLYQLPVPMDFSWDQLKLSQMPVTDFTGFKLRWNALKLLNPNNGEYFLAEGTRESWGSDISTLVLYRVDLITKEKQVLFYIDDYYRYAIVHNNEKTWLITSERVESEPGNALVQRKLFLRRIDEIQLQSGSQPEKTLLEVPPEVSDHGVCDIYPLPGAKPRIAMSYFLMGFQNPAYVQIYEITDRALVPLSPLLVPKMTGSWTLAPRLLRDTQFGCGAVTLLMDQGISGWSYLRKRRISWADGLVFQLSETATGWQFSKPATVSITNGGEKINFELLKTILTTECEKEKSQEEPGLEEKPSQEVELNRKEELSLEEKPNEREELTTKEKLSKEDGDLELSDEDLIYPAIQGGISRLFIQEGRDKRSFQQYAVISDQALKQAKIATMPILMSALPEFPQPLVEVLFNYSISPSFVPNNLTSVPQSKSSFFASSSTTSRSIQQSENSSRARSCFSRVGARLGCRVS